MTLTPVEMSYLEALEELLWAREMALSNQITTQGLQRSELAWRNADRALFRHRMDEFTNPGGQFEPEPEPVQEPDV